LPRVFLVQSDSVSSLQHQVTCAEVTVHILGLSSHAHTSPLKPVHLPVVSFCTSRSLLVFRRTPHRTVVLFISTLKRFAYNSPRFLKARKSSQESLLLGLFEAGMTVSAEGIQSFVAGLLVHRTKLADEWPLVVTLKALPLGRSTLIKPVPVV